MSSSGPLELSLVGRSHVTCNIRQEKKNKNYTNTVNNLIVKMQRIRIHN